MFKRQKNLKTKIGIFLLLFVLAVPMISQGTTIVDQEQPPIIDARQMPFLSEMIDFARPSRINWTSKIFPTDQPYLETVKQSVCVEVYVSNVDCTIQLSTDFRTGKTEKCFQVFRPAEQTVKQLAEIPNSHFYVSKFTPSICMTVEKQVLQQIAGNPSVYCIRVIPPMEPFFAELRDLDDIAYTMSYHDGTVDSEIDIAVIDCGYDVNDGLLGGEANDNIVPGSQQDFTDDDHDVSNGNNTHGTTVLDHLACGFGDSGDPDGLYEDEHLYFPLKICDEDSWYLANQLAPEAIDWCIQFDMEIVCMSWGRDEPGWGINTCNGYWCDRFKTGTDAGITWVAAAGNGGKTNGVAYPAESHFVIAIGGYTNFDSPERWEGSDYGLTYFAQDLIPYGHLVYCSVCHDAQGDTEFKPNAYEAANAGYWGWGTGTSIAAPLACADIAIGIYSRHGGEYTEGYENLLDVIALSSEYSISPDECSLQGDLLDTHTLWHRQVASEEFNPTTHITVGGSQTVCPVALAAAEDFPDHYNSLPESTHDFDYVMVISDTDAGGFFGVRDGTYDVGMMSRLPNSEEWAVFPGAQLWAVAYDGDLGAGFDVSRVLWMVTDGIPAANSPERVGAVFVSFVKSDASIVRSVGYAAFSRADMAGYALW